MEIIQQRAVEIITKYWRVFNWPGQSAGFFFECDKDGNVNASALEPDAKVNFTSCLRGTVAGCPIEDHGVQSFGHRRVTPRMGRCGCGSDVYLDRFTNTCQGCGRDYNGNGDELAPREQWGSETGETVTDILSVDSMSTEELLDGNG